METSAPKRRRTSPRTSVAINNDQTAATSDPPADSSTTSQRPSFASPTKASLLRHNPDILQRRQPEASASQDGPSQGPGLSQVALRGRDSNLATALDAQPEGGTNTAVSGVVNPSSQGHNGHLGPASAPAAGRSPFSSDMRRSPVRRVAGSMASRPRRSLGKPNPRPLPPPAPEREEDLFDPFARRGIRRSPVPGVIPNQESPPEPELPPTPEHPDPVISTPPSGIHNTPTKQPRRSRRSGATMGSSSLKQGSKPAKRRSFMRPAKRPSSIGVKAQSSQVSVSDTSALRGLEPFDPDAEKKKMRDSLVAEIAQLEADLEIANTENERIRNHRPARGLISAPPNGEEILDIMRRHLLPIEQELRPSPSNLLLQAALNPISFLPFNKGSLTLPSLVLPDELASEPGQEPPVSHYPVLMNAEDELPYLKVFTPMTFTSTISMLPRDSPDAPLLQRHNISVASGKPPGMFLSRLQLTIDTKTLAVTDLGVPRLDPAAIAELGPFVEKVIGKKGTSTTSSSSSTTPPARNVSVLAWAMGEWFRVALRRAHFWVLLDRELGSEVALAESVARIRTRRKRARRWKRRDAPADDNDDDGDNHGEGGREDGRQLSKLSKTDLMPHLSRTSMDLQIPIPAAGGIESPDPGGTLRVLWRIEFDWTGEAQSKIGVLTGMPGKWHKSDDRGCLSGLPRLFDELLQSEEDPATAVKTIVALLLSDDGAA